MPIHTTTFTLLGLGVILHILQQPVVNADVDMTDSWCWWSPWTYHTGTFPFQTLQYKSPALQWLLIKWTGTQCTSRNHVSPSTNIGLREGAMYHVTAKTGGHLVLLHRVLKVILCYFFQQGKRKQNQHKVVDKTRQTSKNFLIQKYCIRF